MNIPGLNADESSYRQASLKTTNDLRTIAHSVALRDLSRLSLPEIDAVVDAIGRVIPAGNVPGVILSGMARLSGRKPPVHNLKRDINLLFRGVEQMLDRAVYGTFFAGPAAVIWGYQNLLKLAGKDPDSAFPEGTWQFYVEYALREDTGRHTNETHGFDTLLNHHHIHLSLVDRMTAWVMAAIHTLHQYSSLLENEWRERVYTSLLREVTSNRPEAAYYAELYTQWEKQRPYARGQDVTAADNYPTYRRIKFDGFLQTALQSLPDPVYQQWIDRIRSAEAYDLPAYQNQMSILAYLEPEAYGEARTPISLERAQVGIINQGHYYLIPVFPRGSNGPADVAEVRAQVAALVAALPHKPCAQLSSLAGIKRSALSNLRKQMNVSFVEALNILRLAPILLNFDKRPRRLPLAELRQAERGIGDHALTLFDTGETIVFDQSHIFFDGAWGAALAEIMTNEALAWAVYLNALPPARPDPGTPSSLTLQLKLSDQLLIQNAPSVSAEVGSETDVVNVKAILALRKLFKQRNDLIGLTVNDLLVLYRAIHAVTYQPAPELVTILETLAHDKSTRHAALAALDVITVPEQISPSILIPVDASQWSPRDRLYPMSFEVPLQELDLLNLHQQVIEALDSYEKAGGDRTAVYARFDRLQRTYLATLAGFGAVMSKAKQIAIRGESASVGTIKLLAHIPTPLQRLLDNIPGCFDLLNDIIKGREVFSNVGAVVGTSTLTRFITAKDDNDKKTLAWGVITDANGVMRITLRDFRPHVGLLVSVGHKELAARIAGDYLGTYADGLNQYIKDLRRVTLASRETHLLKPEEKTLYD